MADLRRLAIGAGAVAVGAAAAYGTGKLLVRRQRRRPDPSAAEDFFDLTDLDVEHLHVDTRDGGRLHLLAKGDPADRTVLLVHGVTLQAGIWRYQFALADRYRIVAIDQRGHGRSVAGRDGYGLDRLADDLADVLVALDLRSVVLVGHSMGGMACMRLAARHPELFHERVAAMMLVATTADPVLGVGSASAHRRAGTRIEHRGGRIGWDRLPTVVPPDNDLGFGLTRLVFGEGALPHHVDVTRQMVERMDRAALHQSVVGLLANDALTGLGAITVPCVVVVGSRDLLTPVRAARRIAGALPQAELHVLHGAGHQLMLERPAELAELLDTLVARLDVHVLGPARDRPAGYLP